MLLGSSGRGFRSQLTASKSAPNGAHSAQARCGRRAIPVSNSTDRSIGRSANGLVPWRAAWHRLAQSATAAPYLVLASCVAASPSVAASEPTPPSAGAPSKPASLGGIPASKRPETPAAPPRDEAPPAAEAPPTAAAPPDPRLPPAAEIVPPEPGGSTTLPPEPAENPPLPPLLEVAPDASIPASTALYRPPLPAVSSGGCGCGFRSQRAANRHATASRKRWDDLTTEERVSKMSASAQRRLLPRRPLARSSRRSAGPRSGGL